MAIGNKPNFIFIGPSKTGSSWIFEYLRNHPEVFVPIAKDLQFYDKYYEKGMDWYLKYFKHAKEEIIGELSHDYILPTNKAIVRLKKSLPNVKLICCVRDPYDRALSGFEFRKRNGYIRYGETIVDIAKRNQEIVTGGLNYENIQRVYKYFDRQQVLILRFDDLKNNTISFAEDINNYLGISKINSKILYEVVNKRMVAKNYLIAKYAKEFSNVLRAMGAPGIVGRIKRNKYILKLLFRTAKKDRKLLDEEIEYLRPKFNPDIEKLNEILKMSCLHWLK